jgi:hypothetical protein
MRYEKEESRPSSSPGRVRLRLLARLGGEDQLLGVRAVIAGYEQVHRNNLIGMGILPLRFRAETAESLGLTGRAYDVVGLGPVIASGATRGAEIAVRAARTTTKARAVVRIRRRRRATSSTEDRPRAPSAPGIGGPLVRERP